MPVTERVCNVLLGLNLWAVAAIGLVSSSPAERISAVRICVTFLTCVAGGLFLFRKRLVRNGGAFDVLLTLPSIAGGIVAFQFAPTTDNWPIIANLFFIVGTMLAVVSLLFLGRCFAIFPAVRGTVARGPYRFVRHPIYLGEYLLVLACFMAQPTIVLAAIPLVVLPCIVIRILTEEKLLAEQLDYKEFSQQVTWRLLPGVW